MTVKTLLITFSFLKPVTIFIFDKLQNRNHMSKNRITALSGYAQNTLETATKPSLQSVS